MSSPVPTPPQDFPDEFTPQSRPWYVSALLALVGVTLMLTFAWTFARLKSPHPFFGTYTGTPATPFTGLDQNRQPFTFEPGQNGKVTAMFFGFTHCPNICPLSLAYLDKARNAMTDVEKDKFRILFVSVDPPRDTPERMKEYVSFFGQADAVIIPEPQLSQVAKAYGVAYQKADIKSDTEYQINHTTATYLIDTSGQTQVLWDYTQLEKVDRVLEDIRYVMEHPANER